MATPLASLAHALRNPVQALTHALYVLRLPDLSADEQRRMLLLQERQLSLLTDAVESHLTAAVAGPAGDSAPPTVQSVVGVILRETVGVPGPHRHRVSVRMDDPTVALVADADRVARDVGVMWREAVERLPHASRSVLTVSRCEGQVDVELMVEPDERPVVQPTVPDMNARHADHAETADARIAQDLGDPSSGLVAALHERSTADVRRVYRASIRLRPPHA